MDKKRKNVPHTEPSENNAWYLNYLGGKGLWKAERQVGELKKKKQNVQQRQGKRGKGKAGYIENTIKEEIQI